MKIAKSLSAAFVAALITAACGGGGGDSSPAPTVPTVPVVVVTPTPVPVPVVVTTTCPNGTVVTNATDCPAVGTAPIALQGSVMSPVNLDNGITIQFNGALAPSSVMIMLKQGNTVLGSSWTIAGGDKDVTFKPNVRLAYGQSYTVVIMATDTLGRAVAVTLSFSTSAMVCSSNAVWSNPALYSPPLEDCVAPIGVQALTNTAINTMTDTSCVFVANAAMTASCKAYAANGTLLFANTSIVVQNDPTVWIAYFGADGSSNLVLLDVTTQKVVGKMVLTSPLVWIIGNPTGASIDLRVGTVLRNFQARWDGAAIALTCRVNC